MDDGYLAQESRHSDEGPVALYVPNDGIAGRKTSSKQGRRVLAVCFTSNQVLCTTADGEEYCSGSHLLKERNTAEIGASHRGAQLEQQLGAANAGSSIFQQSGDNSKLALRQGAHR